MASVKIVLTTTRFISSTGGLIFLFLGSFSKMQFENSTNWKGICFIILSLSVAVFVYMPLKCNDTFEKLCKMNFLVNALVKFVLLGLFSTVIFFTKYPWYNILHSKYKKEKLKRSGKANDLLAVGSFSVLALVVSLERQSSSEGFGVFEFMLELTLDASMEIPGHGGGPNIRYIAGAYAYCFLLIIIRCCANSLTGHEISNSVDRLETHSQQNQLPSPENSFIVNISQLPHRNYSHFSSHNNSIGSSTTSSSQRAERSIDGDFSQSSITTENEREDRVMLDGNSHNVQTTESGTGLDPKGEDDSTQGMLDGGSNEVQAEAKSLLVSDDDVMDGDYNRPSVTTEDKVEDKVMLDGNSHNEQTTESGTRLEPKGEDDSIQGMLDGGSNDVQWRNYKVDGLRRRKTKAVKRWNGDVKIAGTQFLYGLEWSFPRAFASKLVGVTLTNDAIRPLGSFTDVLSIFGSSLFSNGNEPVNQNSNTLTSLYLDTREVHFYRSNNINKKGPWLCWCRGFNQHVNGMELIQVFTGDENDGEISNLKECIVSLPISTKNLLHLQENSKQ